MTETEQMLTTLEELRELMVHSPVDEPCHVAENEDGEEVNFDSPDAVSWCFIGGLWYLGGHPMDDIEELLRKQPAHNPLGFTHTMIDGDVVLNIEQAIESLREDV